MKKLKLTPKKRQALKRRILKLYKRRRKLNARRANSNREYYSLARPVRERARRLQVAKKTSRTILAPDNLSLVKNTSETLAFIANLESCLKGRTPVLVDLTDVKVLSLNGILVLLSVMMAFKTSRVGFNGTFPSDAAANKKLTDSGFFQLLYDDRKVSSAKRRITIEQEDTISTHADKRVDSPLADELITKATEIVWGTKRRCKGAQVSLVEMMLNTNNHASPRSKGAKHWWLCVSLDKAKKTAAFAFVDYGVGIFESLRKKRPDYKFFQALQRIYTDVLEKYKYQDNAHIMAAILEGSLHKTSTGKPYHGKGLPSIYRAAESGKITNLHIISNDVLVDQRAKKFERIEEGFSGTFIYFEINENCENLCHEL